jgi:hypothetical protein
MLYGLLEDARHNLKALLLAANDLDGSGKRIAFCRSRQTNPSRFGDGSPPRCSASLLGALG